MRTRPFSHDIPASASDSLLGRVEAYYEVREILA